MIFLRMVRFIKADQVDILHFYETMCKAVM